MATLYKATSHYQTSNTEVKPENGTDFTLEELYKYLECDMIEVIYFNDNTIMIIDEMGKIKEKYYNNQATYIFRDKRKTQDFIVGNAIVCDISELK